MYGSANTEPIKIAEPRSEGRWLCPIRLKVIELDCPSAFSKRALYGLLSASIP
jgi:hypothetical protein